MQQSRSPCKMEVQVLGQGIWRFPVFVVRPNVLLATQRDVVECPDINVSLANIFHSYWVIVFLYLENAKTACCMAAV
jgi:hypothetical protein